MTGTTHRKRGTDSPVETRTKSNDIYYEIVRTDEQGANVLRLTTEEGGYPPFDCMEALRKAFPDIRIRYLAECFEDDLFETNDRGGNSSRSASRWIPSPGSGPGTKTAARKPPSGPPRESPSGIPAAARNSRQNAIFADRTGFGEGERSRGAGARRPGRPRSMRRAPGPSPLRAKPNMETQDNKNKPSTRGEQTFRMRFIKPLIIVACALLLLAAATLVSQLPFTEPQRALVLWTLLPLSLSAVIALGLLFFLIKEGIESIVNMKDVEIEHENFMQRFKVDSLYQVKEHTDDYLAGVAGVLEFVIDNYLADEAVGCTELQWLETIQQMPNAIKLDTDQYRTYMIYAMLQRMDITMEEYEKIGKMVNGQVAKEVLASVLYSPFLFEQYTNEAKEQLDS